jgi:hypothetical protein
LSLIDLVIMAVKILSFDLTPPPLVEDPDRFCRSGAKKRYKENIEIRF